MKRKKKFTIALCSLTAFILWTIAVKTIDVRSVGPEGSAVGFAGLNLFIHQRTGFHRTLYTVTDQLSLIPLLSVMVFALLGLSQWYRRKSLLRVDPDILLLGGFYIVTAAAFLFFEVFVVNYRPVLIEGILEASYPSSTTLLTLCVMPAAALQLRFRVRKPKLRKWGLLLITLFSAGMVICRFLSGVHWFTDIAGGILLSTGLVLTYSGLISR